MGQFNRKVLQETLSISARFIRYTDSRNEEDINLTTNNKINVYEKVVVLLFGGSLLLSSIRFIIVFVARENLTEATEKYYRNVKKKFIIFI